MERFGLPFRSSRVRSCVGFALQLLLIAGLMLIAVQTAHGQDSSPTTGTPLLPALSSTHEMTLRLIARLQERSAQVGTLRTDLAEAKRLGLLSAQQLTDLSEQLAAAKLSVENLQAELTATLSSLDKLSADYKALSTAWEAYKTDAEATIAEVQGERDAERARAERNKWAAIVAGVLAALFGAATGAHAVGWW